jgi:hypothetical protein
MYLSEATNLTVQKKVGIPFTDFAPPHFRAGLGFHWHITWGLLCVLSDLKIPVFVCFDDNG